MKKYIYIGLAVLICISLVLGGCSSTTSTTTQAPTTPRATTTTQALTTTQAVSTTQRPATQAATTSQTTTSTQAPLTTTSQPVTTTVRTTTTTTASTTATPGKVYEFKFTDAFPPQSTTALFGETLAKTISEKTKGRVKFTFYHAEALGKQADFLKMIQGGVVDAATCSVSPYPADFDMELGLEIPGLGIPDRQARMEVTWQLFNQGYFAGLKPYKVLAFGATPPLSFFMKKKVSTVSDLKGLKIRTTSAPMSKYIELLGGTPVTVPSSEAYQALERSIIDGSVTAYEAFIQAKMYEVAKYSITDALAFGALLFLMNKDKWNSLPADLQAQVDEGITAFRSVFLEMTKGPDSTWIEDAKKVGMDVYAFSPGESAKLKAAAIPVKEDWINAHELKGLPARAMLREVESYVASYKK